MVWCNISPMTPERLAIVVRMLRSCSNKSSKFIQCLDPFLTTDMFVTFTFRCLAPFICLSENVLRLWTPTNHIWTNLWLPTVMFETPPFFGQASHAGPLDGWYCSS